MPNIYVYLDESGDLGKHGSKFFTVAAICTKNPKPIENMIKKVRERKLKKKLKDISEFKGNNSSPEIRKHILKKLASLDCSIAIIVITKDQILSRLYESKDKLYNYVVGLLIRNTELAGKDIEVVIDKKTSNKLLQADLTDYIKRQISERKLLFNVEVRHIESHCSKCLQATDFVAWATNRKYSYGEDEYYKLIEPKIEWFEKLWR